MERTRDELTEEWNGEKGVLLVAEEDGRVLGFGRVRLTPLLTEVEESVRPPEGWYLLGTIVSPAHRRRGIGRALVEARLAWVAERAGAACYFVRATNQASIDLHAPFGFEEHTRRFRYPRTGLEVGAGILFRARLAAD